MVHASLAIPFAYSPLPGAVPGRGLGVAALRGVGLVLRALGWLAGSAAAAAAMWLVLAGPGFVSDRASTVPARVAVAGR